MPRTSNNLGTSRTLLQLLACVICLFTASTALSQDTHAFAPSAKEQRRAADAARQSGDTAKSLKLYEKALAAQPGWQEGWFYYGSLLYDQNRYPGAITAFQKLVHLNARLGDAWAMLGLSEYETQDFDHAFTDLEKAEHIGTESDNELQNIVDFHLALILNERGDSDAASLLLSSLFLRGVRSEDLQVALGLSLLRVPIFPSQLSNSKDALIHDAGNTAALVTQKEYEKATLAFDDLLTKYPDVPFIHYALGAMLASTGKDAEAEEQFKAETQLNPESALAYMEWSYVELKNKRYSEAVALARKAVDLTDKSFMAHYLLGNSLLMAGDVNAALPQLEEARTLAPESPEIRYSLSRAYARLGRVDLARQEQTAFVSLQRKNALDRVGLQKKYHSAQGVTGVKPITPE